MKFHQKNLAGRIISSVLMGGLFLALVFSADAQAGKGSFWTKSPLTGNFYTLTPDMTWLDAEAWSQDFGGHLVTLRSWEEELWIKNFFCDVRPFFIGLNAIGRVHPDFVWSSGEPVTYTNWAPGEPNNESSCGSPEPVTIMNDINDQWNDVPLHVTSQGVAEIRVEDELGLVTNFRGDVRVSGQSPGRGQLIERNDLLSVSSGFITLHLPPPEGYLSLRLSGPGAQTGIEHLSMEDKLLLNFLSGELRVKTDGALMEVRTPMAVVGPRGTEFIVEGNESYNKVTVLKGSVEVSTPDMTQSKTVDSNQELLVTPDGLGEPYPMDFPMSEPYFIVNMSQNRILGHEWPAGERLTVSVQGSNQEVMVDEWGDWNITADFDIDPGDVVTVQCLDISMEHEVASLKISEIDADADMLRGTAQPESEVKVNISAEGIRRYVQADSHGLWKADFSKTQGSEHWGSPFNIIEGTQGCVCQYDQHGNSTLLKWISLDEQTSLQGALILLLDEE